MFASSGAPLKIDDVEKSDSYEDDFEPDSTSDDAPKKDSNIIEENKTLDNKDENETAPRISSPTGKEKGQRETESSGRDKSLDSDNESEMDADAYNFTEDQKRAMMELMVQKQEDTDFLDEEPPEYNVKGRLEQLNAELASEPTPQEGDRELKVGFKPEIVDLVAPPPDFSDDESQPNSARGEPQAHGTAPKPEATESGGETNNEDNDTDSKGQNKSEKQFVIEREGNFEVLSADELTASEKALYMPEEEEKKDDKEAEQESSSEVKQSQDTNNNASRSAEEPEKVPKPPTRPRPNTAATTCPRRNLRPAQSPRPKSASNAAGSNSSLNNFNYNSPYAMTPEQKEQSRDVARKSEEERKERERRKQEEHEQRQKENERSFQAWLKAKRDENRRNQSANGERQQTDEERSQEDEIMKLAANVGQSEATFETYDIIYPYLLKGRDPREENNEAYRSWIKEKRAQGKKDKLLKRRQQQEMMEGFYIRPREECEKAFKEWLKKKNADLRRQHEMDRQKNKMYRIQVKRSKKTQVLLKAMKESQAFRYVDYYGYRF